MTVLILAMIPTYQLHALPLLFDFLSSPRNHRSKRGYARKESRVRTRKKTQEFKKKMGVNEKSGTLSAAGYYQNGSFSVGMTRDNTLSGKIFITC